MSIDLILKPSCGACGSPTELYGSTCKHLTLCLSCGKSMAEKRSKCHECGTSITRLIRDDEDEDEADEEDKEGGLSKSGKELKKLLGRSNGLNDSDSEDDDDDDDDDADDDISTGLTPIKEAPKEEPLHNNTPLKATNSTAGRGTPPTSKSSKGKRKVSNEDSKTPNSSPLKKVKPNETKAIKDENVSSSKGVAHPKGATPPASSKSVPAPATGPVTEDEIRAVLLPKTPVTTKDLLAKFRSRLKTKEEKDAFSGIMKRISKIQKTNGATNYVVLRDNLA